jgi:hypothetical protein
MDLARPVCHRPLRRPRHHPLDHLQPMYAAKEASDWYAPHPPLPPGYEVGDGVANAGVRWREMWWWRRKKLQMQYPKQILNLRTKVTPRDRVKVSMFLLEGKGVVASFQVQEAG